MIRIDRSLDWDSINSHESELEQTDELTTWPEGCTQYTLKDWRKGYSHSNK